MKDLARLEAASLSFNTSARLYGPPPTHLAGASSAKRHDDHLDRISVSAAAQSLSEQAVVAKEATSNSKLASLQDRILADSLEIDLEVIADHMMRDMSRE